MSETKSPAQVVVRKDCRACGGILEDLFSLGTQEVINLGDKEPLKAPLDVTKCQSCHLVQLRHTVDKELLFRKYYFRSSANMKEHLKGVAKDIEKRVRLERADIIVDIGANDGFFLSCFNGQELSLVGFEPSDVKNENADVWQWKNDFFSARAYAPIANKAKVIFAGFMFYDLDDPNAFLQDIKKVLAPDGLFVIEMNYLPAMLASNGVDNICHEHLAYYSLLSLCPLLNKNGLYVDEVSFNDANGGSVRLYVKRADAPGGVKILNPSLSDALNAERRMGLDTKQPYLDFAKRAKDVAQRLNLFALRSSTIDILGASTRGATLLQYAGIKGRQTVEKNPDKVGKTYLGMPIVSDEEFKKNPPDYAYVTAHYFVSDILLRYIDVLKRGTKFVIPLPEPYVIEVKPL